MIERLLVSNELGFLQMDPRGGQRRGLDPETATDPLIGVIAQALRIRDGDQKQVKSQIDAIAALDVVLADELVVDPAKAGGDLSEAIRPDQVFFHKLTVSWMTVAPGFLDPGCSVPEVAVYWR